MAGRKEHKLRKLHIMITLPILIIAFFLYGKEVAAAKTGGQQKQQDVLISEWGQDISLKGLFDSSTIYFQIGPWNVEDAQLELHMNVSRLINTKVSYFTVYIDGNPVKTIPVSKYGKDRVSHRISLPLESLNMEGGHSITVETYLRGQTTDACVDDSSISTWVNLLSDSNVTLRYKPLLVGKDIAGFYKKFVSIEALDKKLSLIATRNGADNTSLTTMAHILSGFAQNATGDYEEIKTGVIHSENDLKKFPYVIYVDKYNQLPAYLKASMTEIQKGYAEKSAVVCLIDYERTKVLLVTGNDDISLIKAGDLLSNTMILPTLKNTQVEIKLEKNYKTEPYQWEEYIPLTQYGMEIKGNYEQTASFGVDCPTNKKLADSAELSLDYRYASNLDFEKSLLTVYVNGTPVGSRTLTKEGADGTTEIFSIPKDVNTSRNFTVETQFVLYPKGEWCELTPEDIPWAYVADTSMLKWSTIENTEVFFEYYPFPFIRNGEFSEVKILLPKEWSESDMKVMGSILLTLGKWQKSNGGTLEVICNPTEKELSDVNIISIGDANGNHMDISKLKVIGDLGYAQIGISPYGNRLHGVLTITGEKINGMMNTLKFLGNNSRLWELKGDLFYTDGTDIDYTYIRRPKQDTTKPITPTIFVKNEKLPLVFVISVFVLVLLAVAMLLIKHGRSTKG